MLKGFTTYPTLTEVGGWRLGVRMRLCRLLEISTLVQRVLVLLDEKDEIRRQGKLERS